ncbi:dTDP-4-dehydrorhamnose reductase [Aquimarina litoralis]|uniref:dTDP-4-dehydrorhamnose reductase n=1 Tax=Aquimarina litoralis TaxID=584605 RepID=UPI001C57C8C7|nr:dTDP-4-dehydrorhamnose reductase [Aquimarina litoralis]
MISILVTGANGQLGLCLKKASKKIENFNFSFKTSSELDITNEKSVDTLFSSNKYDYVINCAAYTNVEQSEKSTEKAFFVNAEGVHNLAKVCKNQDITLIHISTDYVFDGNTRTPYSENQITNPINEYGRSKLKGEKYIQEILDKHFIIRTSWLYSEYNKNFFKTILNKSETESKLTITTAEKGTPTNANDLAEFILHIISSGSLKYGIYHFSNLGEATWYDFAEEILKYISKEKNIELLKTDNYPTLAKRPNYSVLSKEKLINSFSFDVLDWKESLRKLMHMMLL